MKKYIVIAFALALISFASAAHAEVYPIAGVSIVGREKLCTGCKPTSKMFRIVNTDSAGNFKLLDLTTDATYELYFNDGAHDPFGVFKATNGVIAGKLTVEVSGQPTPKASFVVGQWPANKIAALKEVLIKEGVLTSTDAAAKTKTTELRAAIMAFQKKYNIKQTGELGPLTVAQLNKVAQK